MALSDKQAETEIPQYKYDFLLACTNVNALTFGTYTLKSKRISPYFFNAGLFHVAQNLRILSNAFAHSLAASPIEFDVLFGPAYKGIPLATATVDKLPLLDESRFGHVSYSFNRKEAKSYGDGGNIVGAPLKGKRVMIIDDVITSGAAAREALDIIAKAGGETVGFIIALDRMEKTPTATDDDGVPGPSAIGQIRKEFGIPVMSILNLNDIIDGCRKVGSEDDIRRLEAYRAKYRASD